MSFSDIGKLFMYIGIGLAVIVVLIYGIGSILQSTAEFRGETGQRERVVADGGYRVSQHDYFYRLCSDIKAKQQNIKMLEEAGEEDAVLANRSSLNEMVEEYNAASANQQKGAFRADGLPYQIKAEEEVTSCGTA